MSNIYDKAHELAKAMKEHEAVTAYREASQRLETDEAKRRMVEDFHKIQYEAYQEQVANQVVSEETKKKLENVVSIIQLNPEVMNFIETEQKFSILVDDIMKILNDAVGIDIIS